MTSIEAERLENNEPLPPDVVGWAQNGIGANGGVTTEAPPPDAAPTPPPPAPEIEPLPGPAPS
ncbi:MAG: hypothetical protein GC136_08120 [Alphaproteobacteria bacterium]|nr:hypothetical protein [Alphaproteobacteria bacterium]